MKRIFFISTVFLLLSLLYACKDDSTSLKNQSYCILSPDLQPLYELMPDFEYGDIHVIGDGILQFESEDHLESVLENLRNECDFWDDIFTNHYQSIDNDSLLQIEKDLNYNPFQPLIEFEYRMNVLGNMLRDFQESALDQWYRSGMLGNMPYDPIFIDEIEQTLYNSYREICIGDTIAQYRVDGSIILIPLSEINDIKTIRTKTIEEIKKDNVLIVKESTKSQSDHICTPIRHKDTLVYINNNYRVKLEYQATARNCFCSPKIKIKVTSKLTNQELKSGSWEKVRKSCSITSQSSFHSIVIDTISYNPLITTSTHNNSNTLYGKTLSAEKNKKQRSTCYTHPINYQNYSEIGIGTNSKWVYSINSTNQQINIFN